MTIEYIVGDLVKRKDGFMWGSEGLVIEKRPDSDGEQRLTVDWNVPTNISRDGKMEAWEIGNNLVMVTSAPRPAVWHGGW